MDKLRENNTKFQNQVADLNKEIRITVGEKATSSWTLTGCATSLSLISDPEVKVAAAERQTLKQASAGRAALQPQRYPTAATRSAQVPTWTAIYSHPPAIPSMVTIVAVRASTLPVQPWTIILRKERTIPVTGESTLRKGYELERSFPAEHLGLVRGPTEIERQIVFACRARATPKDRRDALKLPTS